MDTNRVAGGDPCGCATPEVLRFSRLENLQFRMLGDVEEITVGSQ